MFFSLIEGFLFRLDKGNARVNYDHYLYLRSQGLPRKLGKPETQLDLCISLYSLGLDNSFIFSIWHLFGISFFSLPDAIGVFQRCGFLFHTLIFIFCSYKVMMTEMFFAVKQKGQKVMNLLVVRRFTKRTKTKLCTSKYKLFTVTCRVSNKCSSF